VDYKKHDNKKLTASPRWTVEGRIFFVGGHWPSRATWGDWAGQNGILYKKGLVFILFLFVFPSIAMDESDL
jgi:hypothetical protein